MYTEPSLLRSPSFATYTAMPLPVQGDIGDESCFAPTPCPMWPGAQTLTGIPMDDATSGMPPMYDQRPARSGGSCSGPSCCISYWVVSRPQAVLRAGSAQTDKKKQDLARKSFSRGDPFLCTCLREIAPTLRAAVWTIIPRSPVSLSTVPLKAYQQVRLFQTPHIQRVALIVIRTRQCVDLRLF
jgi:hypothetical protein